jgi:anti-sigma factor RsiW
MSGIGQESGHRAQAALSCERFSRLFEAMVDGDLPQDEMRAARAHLRACEACRLEYERATACRQLLRSSATIRPSGRVRAAVMAGARREQGRRLTRARWMRLVPAALAPALAAAALALLLPRPHELPVIPGRAQTTVARAGAEMSVPPSVEPPQAGASLAVAPDLSRNVAKLGSQPQGRAAAARVQAPATQEPAPATRPSPPRPGADVPNYVTASARARSSDEPTGPAQPVILVSVPEPDGVYNADAKSRFAL